MPALTAALLLLADSRFPAGAHAHSGSIAAAVEARTVYDEPTLALFLAGRLATTGLVAAAAAARAAFLATTPDAIIGNWNGTRDYPGVFGAYSFSPTQHNGYPQDGVVMSQANSQKDGAFTLAPA
jgi:hypothetical protein